MRHTVLAFSVVMSALLSASLWCFANRPVEVQPSWNAPLSSVSFAPFRRGQSPLTKVYPTPEQVEQDLAALQGLSRGIRTYSAREGMEVVPKLAGKLGLKVIFGAWLTNESEAKGKATNEAEIAALISAANEYPQEIERVLVGNEVLLRRDLKPDELIGYIRRVKAAVKQPVSYADVWAFYLKYPEVARELDYLTIHILPFWEDEPVPIDQVEAHIVKIVERIRQAFPGKPVLIGEAGWPSIGRDRGPAVVSTVNEARFVRTMAEIAQRHQFDYNIVEAFDQPWKAALENTVGAAWGILDIDRHAKFTMAGPVTEVADWPKRAAIAIACGAFSALLLGRRLFSLRDCFLLAVFAQLLAWAVITTAFHADAVSFRWWQDLWTLLRGGLAAGLAIAVLARVAVLLRDPTQAEVSAKCPIPDRLGASLTVFYGVYGVCWSFLLLVDGRYRDIPDIDFCLPVVALGSLLFLRAWFAKTRGQSVARALAFEGLFIDPLAGPSWRKNLVAWLGPALLAGALMAFISEGWAVIGEDFQKEHPTLNEQLPLVLKGLFANREMLLWCLMQCALSVPYWVSTRLRGQSS